MKKLLFKTIPILVLVAAVMLSLYFLVQTILWNAEFSRMYLWLFGASIITLMILAIIIIQRLVGLWLKRKRGEPGILMTSRLVFTYIALSLPPVIVVYLFASFLVNNYIDSWFDVKTDSALNDALSLGQIFLETQTTTHLNTGKSIADQLAEIAPLNQPTYLNRMLDTSKASVLTIFNNDGGVVANSSLDPLELRQPSISQSALSGARRGQNYARIEPTTNQQLQIRVVVPIESPASINLGQKRILQGLFPIPEQYQALATNIETQFLDYNQQTYQRQQLKLTFLIILTVVLLISVLLAMIWAFSSARKLVAPIRLLSEATQAITEGDYNIRIPVTTHDEMGTLVESFNSMSTQIASASALAHRAQSEAENQRWYLENVLSRLSSGVLSIDEDLRIRMSNAASGQILNIDNRTIMYQNIDYLSIKNNTLKPLIDLIKQKMADHANRWQQEVLIAEDSLRRILVVRGSRILNTEIEGGGMVVVFDDETIINQAQRDAAWSEVARRLAHEVKNPLTPIQLSAERLRMRFLGKLSQEDDEILDRSTQTIISQVETLKTLVNAFSDYAKPPELRKEMGGLNQLIMEVVDLYSISHPGSEFVLNLLEPEPQLLLDKLRFNQLINNLIKNAQESVDEGQPKITIDTHEQDNELILTFTDNGHGFDEKIIDHVFEPYETTKIGGSGLGLAIVKKIVEEHGGSIQINNLKQGAAVIIALPIG
ncbi:ATP-binding protein [Marinicella sp. W31]|uniref:sensor histidine kinase n=1 Tax=Marinicella sp. W31 TaxID=3023713 RepID=UPI003756E251